MTDLADRRDAETEVYQPAEDSRLLAAAVAEGVEGRRPSARGADREAGIRVLDVGTGSGYVAVRVAAETGASVVASDVNPHACRQARQRAREADAPVDVVRGDLLDPFGDDGFDVVCCNPPYLPEVPEAARDDWMEVALSGGEDGRAVVDPFVDDVGRVLRPGGAAYLLVSSLTGVDAVVERAAANGFSAAVVAEQVFPFETLTALRLFGITERN